MDDSLAILPRSMGTTATPKKKADPTKFLPTQRGGLVLSNPKEEECPYTFSDSPAYIRQKKAEEAAKRAVELESQDETRGFLRSVEELAKKQKWDEAFQVLERRTAVPSGLFLVTRAVLRWKFGRYAGALRDAEEALKNYSSSSKAGPLAAAFSSISRLCLGSEPRERASCSRELSELISTWEQAEERTLEQHVLGQGLFKPRVVERQTGPSSPVEGMEATDGTFVASNGTRIGLVLLKNQKDPAAPVMVHFHGTGETAADYRLPALAEKYKELGVHLFVADYRGYGWSQGQPSLATFLRDAEHFAEALPELFVQQGFAWPYPGGLIVSGRSLGAQVAIHLTAMFPTLFRALILDSALSTSATGDRLGRNPERTAVMARWSKELEQANLEVLKPLDVELRCLSALEKLSSYEGRVLVLHGINDDVVPYESGESLHAAAKTRNKELVLIEGAGHNDIGRFDSFWHAQRRLTLKVQLDDTLPSIGPVPEHLCAVCAEKASNKCGRCQKVWYCGRKHQAEHWAFHKLKCAGGPPEPKPKVEPEADASLVALVAATVNSETDARSLRSALECVTAQVTAFQAVYVSWFASSPELQAEVNSCLQRIEATGLKLISLEARTGFSEFEHHKVLAQRASWEAPADAWACCISPQTLLSPRWVSTLLPSLRKAAADSRVVAATCTRKSRPLKRSSAPFGSLEEVEAAVAEGSLGILEDSSLCISDVFVKAKALQAALDATPAAVLSHPLCSYRVVHKLTHTFGKKVYEVPVQDGEWLRCVPFQAEEDVEPTELDRRRALELFEGLQRSKRLPAAPGAEVQPFSWEKRFGSEDLAIIAVAQARRTLERQLVIRAGESITAEDLKSLAKETVDSFCTEVGLDEVIGIQRWARDTATELSEAIVNAFSIKVSRSA